MRQHIIKQHSREPIWRRWLILLMSIFVISCGTVALPPTSTVPTPTPEPIGNAINGDLLFHTIQPEVGMACSTCHFTDREDRLIGPGLFNIATRGSTRIEGVDTPTYIHNSILDPSSYVVEGYPNIMPKGWGRAFSEEEIQDITAWLLTLHD